MLYEQTSDAKTDTQTPEQVASLIHPRHRFAKLEKFPFRRDFTISDSLFRKTDSIRNFAASLQAYQNHVTKAEDMESKCIRRLLGFRTVRPTFRSSRVAQLMEEHVQPDDFSSILRPTYDKIVKFVSSLCILERHLELFSEDEHFIAVPPIGKTLLERHTKEPVMKYWTHLRNFPRTLKKVRSLGQNLLNRDPKIPELSALDDPHIKLLKQLAYQNEASDADVILDNFRCAAINLAYVLSLPALEGVLPELPDNLALLQRALTNGRGLAEVHAHFTSAQQDMVKNLFTALETRSRGKGSPRNQLSLALELTFLISPLYLFVKKRLRDVVSWAREHIFEVSLALGNQKPPVLLALEAEILHTLISISETGKDVGQAVFDLTKAEIWTEAENLDEDDPALNFFAPVSDLTDYQTSTAVEAREVIRGNSEPIVVHPQKPGEIDHDRARDTEEPGVTEARFEEPLFEGRANEDMGVQDPKRVPQAEVKAEPIQGIDSTGEQDNEDLLEESGSRDEGEGQEQESAHEREGEGEERKVSLPGLSNHGKNTTNSSSPFNAPYQDDKVKRRFDGSRRSSRIATSTSKPGLNGKLPSYIGQQSNSRRRIGRSRWHKAQSLFQNGAEKEAVQFSNKIVDGNNEQLLEDGSQVSKICTLHELNPSSLTPLWKPLRRDIFEQPQDTMETNVAGQGLTKHSSQPLVIFKPSGQKHTFTPVVADANILDFLMALHGGVERLHADGKPLHRHDPSKSCLRVLEAYEMGDDREVQEAFRKQHFVITGRPFSKTSFSNAVLRLGPSFSVVDIHDPVANCTRRGKLAIFQELYRKGNDSKALWTLDVPQPLASIAPDAFSSDLHALHGTNNCAGWRNGWGVHIGAMRFASCLMKGVVIRWHMAPHGFAKYIDVIHGSLWVLVLRPKTKDNENEPFLSSHINCFLPNNFDLNGMNEDAWDIEDVYLEPGTRFVIRPNTLITIFSIEHTVFESGFFYAMSTIQDTFFGLVHDFMLPHIADLPGTVAEEDDVLDCSRFLLRQMIMFTAVGILTLGEQTEDGDFESPHIPRAKNMESAIDLMTLGNLGLLLNVLDYRSYVLPGGLESDDKLDHLLLERYDYNALDYATRCQTIYARSLSATLLDWLGQTRKVCWDDDGLGTMAEEPAAMLVNKYLALQCRTIVEYRRRCSRVQVVSTGGSLSSFESQIGGIVIAKRLLALRNAITEGLNVHDSLVPSWLCFPRWPGQLEAAGLLPNISLSKFSLELVHKSSWNAIQHEPLGFSVYDRRYLEFLHSQFNIEPGPYDYIPVEHFSDEREILGTMDHGWDNDEDAPKPCLFSDAEPSANEMAGVDDAIFSMKAEADERDRLRVPNKRSADDSDPFGNPVCMKTGNAPVKRARKA